MNELMCEKSRGFVRAINGWIVTIPHTKGENNMAKTKNRWLIAAAAVGIHISIGSVYSWSVFSNPLNEKHGWTSSEVALTFSIAILFNTPLLKAELLK